jgi:mercuric ion binding protein
MRVRLIAALGLLIPAFTIAPTTWSIASASASELAVTAQKVTFVVENMSCALCPVTVRTAMARVPGVKSVEVEFKTKTATAVFDPAITTVEAIAAASTNAGYPARPASN